MLGEFAFLGLHGVSAAVVIIALVLIFIFEVWMLVSAITNKHITTKARVWWVIGMLLIHPIVAIAYYFTDYRKAQQ